MNFYQRMAFGIFSMLTLGGSLPQALAANEPVVLRIYAPAASSAAAKPAKELANGRTVMVSRAMAIDMERLTNPTED